MSTPADGLQGWVPVQLGQLAKLAAHAIDGDSPRRTQELNGHTAQLMAVGGRLAADPAGREALRHAAESAASAGMLRFWAARSLETTDLDYSREIYRVLCGASAHAANAMTLPNALGYMRSDRSPYTAALRLSNLNEQPAD